MKGLGLGFVVSDVWLISLSRRPSWGGSPLSYSCRTSTELAQPAGDHGQAACRYQRDGARDIKGKIRGHQQQVEGMRGLLYVQPTAR